MISVNWGPLASPGGQARPGGSALVLARGVGQAGGTAHVSPVLRST